MRKELQQLILWQMYVAHSFVNVKLLLLKTFQQQQDHDLF